MPSKIIIFGFFLFFVGVVGGMVARPLLFSPFNTTKNSSQSVSDVSDTTNPNYQAGFNAAKKLVENSSIGGMFKTPDDIRALVGTVTSIGEGKLTLHISSGNPFDDQTFADRTIILDASTKVNVNVKKDPSAYQAEGAIPTETSQRTAPVISTTPMKAYPVEVTLTPASVSDIKVGDIVDVFASDNIKMAKEFTASEVQILSKTLAL